MRKAGELFYILGDHLGSTSIVTDANGTKVSEMRYRAASLWDKAWGEVRYESGASPTEYTYTGQYSYTADFGLMFYNARWYDPGISHFTQPDTIVPDSYNPLDWNRYSYVRYNPLKYTDPSGHAGCETGKKCLNPKVTSSNAKKSLLANSNNKSLVPTPPLTPMPTRTAIAGYRSTSTPFMPSPSTPVPTLTSLPTVISLTTPQPQPIPIQTPGGGTPYPHQLYPSPPLPELPSGWEILESQFAPAPLTDPNLITLVGQGFDTIPAFGYYPNPLFGKGRAIAEGINAFGMTMYGIFVYGEFPDWGAAPTPIISTPSFYTPMPVPLPVPTTGTPQLR